MRTPFLSHPVGLASTVKSAMLLIAS